MGIGNYFMNTNVDLFHDSTNNSNGILTSGSNEMGSLKIIMPDKLTQLSIKSSYICHVDDPMIDRGNYYYPDISSDLKEGYDYSLTRMLMSSYNDGIHEPDPKGLFDSFPLLGLMLSRICKMNDNGELDGYTYNIRLNNMTERDLVIDNINMSFITYDNMYKLQARDINVREDIPQGFIRCLNLFYKFLVDNIVGCKFSIRIITGYDYCVIDEIDAFCPIDRKVNMSTKLFDLFGKFLDKKKAMAFNVVNILGFRDGISWHNIGFAITKIYDVFSKIIDVDLDSEDDNNKIVHTYLGSGNSNGYIKIGKSRDVSKREDSIRIGNADFKIIAFIDRDIENELHKKFSSKRVNGEWFNLSEKDIENIINEYGFTRLRSSVKNINK